MHKRWEKGSERGKGRVRESESEREIKWNKIAVSFLIFECYY